MFRFSERIKADLTLLLVTVFWGTAFAVLRIALEHHIVHYLNGLRLLLGAAILFPLAVWQKERIEKTHLPIILLTGFVLFAAAGLQMIGLVVGVGRKALLFDACGGCPGYCWRFFTQHRRFPAPDER